MAYNFDLGLAETDQFIEHTRGFTIGDQIRKAARMHPERVALAEPERQLTYAELDERTDRLAEGLLSAGYEPNESTIAVLSENRGETVELLLACAKVGILVPTLNWRLEREELVHCVDLAEPDSLVVSERFSEKLSWIDSDCASEPEFIQYDAAGAGSFEGLVSENEGGEPLSDITVDPEQGFVVLNTSGTTGLPKGVVISHRAEFARAQQVTMDYGLERGDSYPGWAPMFHMGGIDWIVTTAFLRGTFYPIDGFDPERIVDVMLQSSSPISWLYLVPGAVERLVEYVQERGVEPEDFPEIRTMGALPDLLDPDLIREATETFDTPFQNTYGASETGHVTSGNKIPVGVSPSETELAKTESPCIDFKLIDEDWNEVENRGELAVRGPPLCSGYIDAPETNREDFQNGWFRTGDIFTRDHNGYNFVSRRKYLIKSGGENIYPSELEDPVAKLDEVEDVVVVKADDDDWGEVPRMIVAVHGIEDEHEMRDHIFSVLETQIGRYKLPHYIEFCEPETLPRSTSGKVVRPDLEEWPLDESARVRNP